MGLTTPAGSLQEWDKAHFWHPFTQMRDWCAPGHDPLILASAQGAVLTDAAGKEYIDGNASIWTNIHGHRHPAIDAAIRNQLNAVAHVSALGFTNEPAILLAKELASLGSPGGLSRVFFTDDGSTAIECACKMALQYWQHQGHPERTTLLAFDGAYHGDTAGAASLGGIDTFHNRFRRWGYETVRISTVEDLEHLAPATTQQMAAAVIEPLIQGAAGMRLWPSGTLRLLREWCDHHDLFLIADEVMTGFGRTGSLFACEQEQVWPDLLCLAKGLTGGYLPLAATLATDRLFEAFLGSHAELKTFFYGHSYCGNALGCAAALASLKVFQEEGTLEKLPTQVAALQHHLATELEPLPAVGEIRQLGLIAGIDLVDPSQNGAAHPWERQTGARVCLAARNHGLLTRPIGDTLVLMPPLCITEAQIHRAVRALRLGIEEICSGKTP